MVFVFLTLIIIIPAYFRHKEKMTAIEKGIYVPSPQDRIRNSVTIRSHNRSPIGSIAVGIGFLAVSLIIFTIMIFPAFFGMHQFKDIFFVFTIVACVFLGVGASSLTYGILTPKSEKENKTPQP